MKTHPDGTFEFDEVTPLDFFSVEAGLYEFKPAPKAMPGERYRMVEEAGQMMLYTANGMLVAVSEPLQPKQ
jgi:hypothetical protein